MTDTNKPENEKESLPNVDTSVLTITSKGGLPNVDTGTSLIEDSENEDD